MVSTPSLLLAALLLACMPSYSTAAQLSGPKCPRFSYGRQPINFSSEAEVKVRNPSCKPVDVFTINTKGTQILIRTVPPRRAPTLMVPSGMFLVVKAQETGRCLAAGYATDMRRKEINTPRTFGCGGGPYCGDGILDDDEECERPFGETCNTNCKLVK